MTTSPKFLAIGSGKGGTGKTMIAVSLAHALAHEGERVLLCDADLGLSNTTVHLGLDSGGDLAGVLTGRRALADAVVPVFGGITERGGFDVLAAPAGSGALADIEEGQGARLVETLRRSTRYDRIVLDLGAGVDATTMHFAAASDSALLVMTPDPASLADAYAFAKLLKKRGAKLPYVVVNMAANDAEARRTSGALGTTCQAFLGAVPEYLGGIPRDPHVSEAVRRQSHLLTMHPQAAAAVAISTVARRLHNKITQPVGATHASGLR
ncbi:MAG TPA: P-loop NTPase [Rhizomicrobium sp.]|jgi:flagellar biosynthesis protein FlhG